MRSFMRLMDRNRVDFPQPDGPMRAVTRPCSMLRVLLKSACARPYQREKPSISMIALRPPFGMVYRVCVIEIDACLCFHDNPLRNAPRNTSASVDCECKWPSHS